jgi:hypothetical protein
VHGEVSIELAKTAAGLSMLDHGRLSWTYKNGIAAFPNMNTLYVTRTSLHPKSKKRRLISLPPTIGPFGVQGHWSFGD